MKIKDKKIWQEMARRKTEFHKDEDWNNIYHWGLFRWVEIFHLLRSGDLITTGKKKKIKQFG